MASSPRWARWCRPTWTCAASAPPPEPYGRYGQAVAQEDYGQPGDGADFDADEGYQTLDEAGYAPGAGLSQYRYVTLPGNEAAVVEPRSRRIILIVE